MLTTNHAQRTSVILRVAAGLSLLAAAICTQAAAQSRPAAYGPGSYIQIGGTGSIFQADYSQRNLGGDAAFVNAHLYRRIGVEAEVRTLQFQEDEDVHETTYLVGPRFSILPGRLPPYGKLLVGRGDFYFPFHHAKGSYFVVAPGTGVDWQVGNPGNRLSHRCRIPKVPMVQLRPAPTLTASVQELL